MEDDFEFPAYGSNEMGLGDEMDAGDDVDFPPTQKVGEEREIGKDGLKKKLLREGEGWEKPNSGDEVEGTFLPF